LIILTVLQFTGVDKDFYEYTKEKEFLKVRHNGLLVFFFASLFLATHYQFRFLSPQPAEKVKIVAKKNQAIFEDCIIFFFTFILCF
jgi:hypothetical protein